MRKSFGDGPGMMSPKLCTTKLAKHFDEEELSQLKSISRMGLTVICQAVAKQSHWLISLWYAGHAIWDSLPLPVRNSSPLSLFPPLFLKPKLKTSLFSSGYWSVVFFSLYQPITSNACICSVCVLTRACVCVCMCVCERERECVCVCVCVMKWVHPYIFVSALGSCKIVCHK